MNDKKYLRGLNLAKKFRSLGNPFENPKKFLFSRLIVGRLKRF